MAKLGLDANSLYLVHLLTKSGLTKSNGEARKLIGAGAVTLNDEKVTDVDYEFRLQTESILKVGKLITTYAFTSKSVLISHFEKYCSFMRLHVSSKLL